VKSGSIYIKPRPIGSFNCSFSTGVIPSSWRTAIVTPVPKISKPAAFADYRPIGGLSVTPLLSRLAERIVVIDWLRPALSPSLFLDQYAFKPTGSCTAALVHFTHYASLMLESNHFVRCLMINFSKAFDSVDHAILLSKLVRLSIAPALVNWICSFLTGCVQLMASYLSTKALSKVLGLGLFFTLL